MVWKAEKTKGRDSVVQQIKVQRGRQAGRQGDRETGHVYASKKANQQLETDRPDRQTDLGKQIVSTDRAIHPLHMGWVGFS
mmetsp:Transcript_34706/g.86076  ORF Transcript_34706/g.86076 Transcript_34706/m.86076 type:complete len:81 (-) Transcript_34706:661-903(-)